MLFNVNFMYSDANCFLKQLCTCMEVQVREVIEEGKSDILVICGTGVEGSDFTTVTPASARPQTLPKTGKPFGV